MMEQQSDDPFTDPSIAAATQSSSQDLALDMAGADDSDHRTGLLGAPEPPVAQPTLAHDGAAPSQGQQQAGQPQQQQLQQNGQKPNSFCGCLSLAFYKPYFDVDTEDIVERLRTVAIPERELEKNTFMSLMGERPDMYGPFWICTTLVFSMAVASNLSNWWEFKGQTNMWTYDFSKIVSAASLIFGYQALMPVAVWFALRYMGVQVAVVQTLTLYGYGILAFVPATALCTITSSLWLLQWLVMLAATAHSLWFVYANMWPWLSEQLGVKAFPVMATMAAAHAIFFLSLKIVFF